ncbi:MAG: sulfotransferase [Rikenellaceae bacterium]
MKFEFSKLPITTLIGADWKTFKEVCRGREIDPKYRGKYRLTAILCWLISLLGIVENWKYQRLLAKQKLEKDPVFVLGHWRSGTTFVHNVLSCDKQFGYTTTYQTVFPNVMLFLQPMFKSIMQRVMPDKRPMDSLELKPDLPQEEEFALSGMTPYSYYNFWFFPRDMMEYCQKYLLMRDISNEERDVFGKAFEKLIKLSLYNTGGSRYLSKNPPHTGRVKELLKLFPNAKFIFLMRNPYTVFESTRGFFTQTIVPLKLQEITDDQLTASFVEVYKRLYDKYQEDKVLIPEGNLVEIKFEEFEADPMGATERIYSELSLEGFEEARPSMEYYIGGKSGHKKNKYKYADKTVKTVEANWGRALREWNYHLERDEEEEA